MANFNRPPPIRSMSPMLHPRPFPGGRSIPSFSQPDHSTWNTQALRVMPVYRPTLSTSVGEQIVPPIPQQQSLSCWSIVGQSLPTHYPPPAPVDFFPISQRYQIPNYELMKSAVNFESILTSWLNHYEPIFIERRRQYKEQNNIQLPVYRNMLVKWSELIRNFQSSLSSIDELNTVQQYCTDPHIINLVKKKLRLIQKKRRYLKRLRDRRQNSPVKSSICPVIVQSTTGSILERLKADIALTSEQCSVHNQQEINTDNIANSIIDNESKCQLSNTHQKTINNPHPHHHHHDYQVKFTLRKSIDECQTRLKLLDNLQQLRSARLLQAKQQGGLFPYQLDEKFNSDVNELKNQLTVQIKKLESLYSKVKCSRYYHSFCMWPVFWFDSVLHQNFIILLGSQNELELLFSLSQINTGEVAYMPKLLSAIVVKKKIESTSKRWERFYHQADYNFCDFIRIRYAWDKYLKMDIPTNENIVNSYIDLQLPKNWILPQLNYDTTTHTTNPQEQEEEDNEMNTIQQKWRQYIKPIPLN
ncbi:unnamed protein product [Schistosoma turkestanicum]|nr:unnamed protein product [Schistosoma turkestanicum]